MGLLSTLTWGKPARVVAEAIAATGAARGPLLVVGAPRLARVLAERGFDVRAPGDQTLASRSFAGLVFRSVLRSDGDGPDPALWRGLVPGGAVVLLGASPASEQSRRALCAGLVDLEQRRARRLIVTSGRTPVG